MKHLSMTLKAVETAERDSGEFEAILSTSMEDRDGEIVAPFAFDPLPETIPIYYQHDWQQKALPIGRGKPFYDEQGTLMIRGYYGSDDRSQSVRKAVGEGLVDSMSAGYLPQQKKRVRSDGKSLTEVTKGDLFEGSMTAIPCNKTALVLASKAIEDAATKTGARNNSSDMSRLQQIHDLSVENGAGCATGKSLRAASTKAIAGSVEALQARVDDALGDQYGDRYLSLRGVVPGADGGTCYFDAFGQDGDIESYQQTYTDDGAVVTLTGDAAVVDILETVSSDADADREEGEDALKSAAPASATQVPDAAAPDLKALAEITVSENAMRLAFSS